jgi:drug/metabolite transporter (DMT)-like permease
MYFAHLSDTNVGVLTTLWCVQPVFSAILDYFINNEPIRTNHVIGMILVIGSGVAISMSGAANVKESAVEVRAVFDAQFPQWPAVCFGLVTPMFMIANSLWIKHMTQPEIGFDALTNSFSSTVISSTLILVVGGSWYW